uniref:Reverse transcriptase zinc-binding domain-containing protein n=1 Tax=Fagus sylvatica TaxID=28930 RepID=A0A2N9F1W7_FAGSY
MTKKPQGTHGCSLWKGIFSGWDFFLQQVELVAGLGIRIRFWHDTWCGDAPLKTRIPLLFACSTSRSASIAFVLLSSNVRDRIWNLIFVRDFNDWEVKENGEFDVKSFYHALDVKVDIKFPWRAIWRVKAPCRVSFFLWSAAWGRILTCDNLMCRGYTLVGWCCMCRNAGETGNHLLIHCTLASALWHLVLRSFGVPWVFPNNIADLLFGWFNCFGKHNCSIGWYTSTTTPPQPQHQQLQQQETFRALTKISGDFKSNDLAANVWNSRRAAHATAGEGLEWSSRKAKAMLRFKIESEDREKRRRVVEDKGDDGGSVSFDLLAKRGVEKKYKQGRRKEKDKGHVTWIGPSLDRSRGAALIGAGTRSDGFGWVFSSEGSRERGKARFLFFFVHIEQELD